MKVLHLNLTVFSNKGGIEQVAKNWMYSFSELQKSNKVSYKAFSLYDNNIDLKYIQKSNFRFYKGNKIYFGISTLLNSLNKDVLILSHIHLSLFALLAKILNPKLKIWIQLHGIEAWNITSVVQIIALRIADKILPVSNFTKYKVLEKFPEHNNKTEVLNNTLDPFYVNDFSEEKFLKARIQLNIEYSTIILLSVGRMRSDEAYKGYDKVIEALSIIDVTNLQYFLIGKADEDEKLRIKKLISKFNLENAVKFTGQIDDETLINYYQASNLLVMPSIGEGFGIVFIDSMANGLPVIAGNRDGSADALQGSKLSTMVNPFEIKELSSAIQKEIFSPSTFSDRMKMAKEYMVKYGSITLTNRLKEMIN